MTPAVGAAARGRGEAGVAILEAALVAPVVLLLVLAIFEYGLVYRDYLTIGDSISEGARTGAIVGTDVDPETGESADWYIVSAIRQSSAVVDFESIDRIVIFQPDSDNPTRESPLSLVPEACRTSTVSLSASNCNVYIPSQAFAAIESGDVDFFRCAGTGPACGYDPTDRTKRNDEPGDGWSRARYIGVYIDLDREMVTGLFGREFRVEDASIALIEPRKPNEAGS
jgi:hypothetical protein